jgi:hypothetical protein
MAIEIVGFLSGVGAVCAAGLVLMRHELRQAMRAAYGRRGPGQRPGNALIWPSR